MPLRILAWCRLAAYVSLDFSLARGAQPHTSTPIVKAEHRGLRDWSQRDWLVVWHDGGYTQGTAEEVWLDSRVRGARFVSALV
jgi:hypothetical protein